MRSSGLVVAIAIVAFGAGALWVLEAGGRGGAAGAAPGSVFNPGPEGLSLAHRYLEERARARAQPPPSVLAERPRADNLPPGGVLFRVRPERLPHRRPASAREPEDDVPLLTDAEEAWVRSGGRLVLALGASYGPVEADLAAETPQPSKVFPVWPGVRSLMPSRGPAALSGPPVEDGVTLLVSGASVLASRSVLGAGEVLLLGLPELLENGRLQEADHLLLLEQLAGSGRPLLFDEWTHGLDRTDGLLPRLFDWGFGPSILLGGVAFGLALWRGRARLGPPEPEPPESRSEAVDLVESLAQLYERALSRRDAARLHLQGFERAVALHSGLSGAALERRIGELLGEAGAALPEGEISAAEFGRRLSRVNDGYRRLYEHARAHRRP